MHFQEFSFFPQRGSRVKEFAHAPYLPIRSERCERYAATDFTVGASLRARTFSKKG